MSTKHTPGPWHIAVYGDMEPSFTIVKGELNIAKIVGPRKYMADYRRTPTQDISEDNARLIAAAPDLLEACKAARANIIADLDCSDVSRMPADERNRLLGLKSFLESAISKAIGGQS